MIHGLTPIREAQAVLARLSAIEVNALLQLGIEILEKREDGLYLIKMGAHTLTSKSDEPLEPGRNYWAAMSQSKEGIVQLGRLLVKPSLLQKPWPTASSTLFAEHLLHKLATSDRPSHVVKEELLQHLANATDRQSFQYYSQLLLSLHHGVLSLPLRYRGKKGLLQMRPQQEEEDLNQKSVEFYAALNNIGPVEGVVRLVEEGKHLRLGLYYPKSVALLKKESETLQGFDTIEILLKEEPILPLWDEKSGTGLLDIKG